MQSLGRGGCSYRLPLWSLLSGRVFPRCSATKVFVGGLSYDTNEIVLRDAFQQLGDIIEAKVVCDHVSGKSKGYGFIRFDSETAAAEALKKMDGQLLDGRNIRVQYPKRQNGRHS
ncbi:hypothetical protein SAY87_028690 [Trapa incisa]|uniref:RRM domain-containing protein n=1 Tax=Trapa incisa TaxID=236973 RepID=A0AAN7QQC2_9MYRT|nr:hypothetical protein SAY87_028690 [Trapa incisa]